MSRRLSIFQSNVLPSLPLHLQNGCDVNFSIYLFLSLDLTNLVQSALQLVLMSTLNTLISVGHSNFLDPTLILNPHQISSLKLVWAHYLSSRKLMWVTILFFATFVLKLTLKCGSLRRLRGRPEVFGPHYFHL